MIALSRQSAPAVRLEPSTENLCARGAYELRAAEGPARATLFATGTEVALALDARERLQAEGVATRVVSVPCWSLLEAQDEAYRRAVIGDNGPGAPVRVAVEAGVRQGWERFTGEGGGFVGRSSFGASASPERLYQAFDITADHLVAEVKARL